MTMATTNRKQLNTGMMPGLPGINSGQLSQQTITVTSFNMHGFSQGFSTVRDL